MESAPVDCEPEVAFDPDQASLAVQLLALVEVHVSVALPLTSTVAGLALSVTTGADGVAFTVTVTVRSVAPPRPVHSSTKLVVAFRTGVCWLPDVAFAPDQPPVAAHAVAFVELHVSVERAPLVTVVGLAEKVTPGAASKLTATVRWVVPPAPVHERLKLALPKKGPTLSLPWVLLAPGHPANPPLPVQLVALLVVHCRVAKAFSATDVGLAEKFTVGAGVDEATVTFTVRLALPPSELVQASVNAVDAAIGPMVCVPLSALLPLQPLAAGAALAVQAFASATLHVRFVVPCGAIEVGLAEKVMFGLVTPPPWESL